MFFILPVAVDYEARRYPVVTFTVMGLNALLYLISLALLFGSEEGAEAMITGLGLVPVEKSWWTWLTSMFVHAGFFHFVGNMIYLFLFGACVEDLLGRGRFSCFYIGGGLLANLSQVLLTTEPESRIPIVGASGAISACIGAFLILLPRTRINFRYFAWIFFRIFSGDFWLSARIVIGFWFALDFLSLLAELGQEGGGGVAFGAHVGGTIAGALTAWGLRRSLKDPEAGDTAVQPLRPVMAVSAPETVAQPPTIYLFLNGQQIGPFAEGRVREMLALGSVTSDALYWREGMPDWRPLAEL
jgi:membrane associated rhomboid family serine protease